MGMQFHGIYYADEVWDVYWFERDLLGNVVAVYDESGNKLVSYYYDAWGNCEVEYDDYSDDMVYFAAYSNPFRYRGYYYDYDLGMYYLNSRYYDARNCRFISPDVPDVLFASPYSITDKNLYAYCDNDPVNRVDYSGEFWHIVIGGVVGAVISGVSSGLSQLVTTGSVNWLEVGISTAAGTLSGVLAASGAGMVAQIAGNALISGAESFLSQGVSEGFENVNFASVAMSSVVGGVMSIGGGISKGEAKHLMRAGVNTVKNFRGVAQTSKYYFSQTYKMFYKPLSKNILKNVAEGIGFNIANYQFDRHTRGVLYA